MFICDRHNADSLLERSHTAVLIKDLSKEALTIGNI